MEQSNFFAFVSRMKYIERWGLMRNGRRETLMEHCYETALIANALANIQNQYFGADIDTGLVTQAALFHDASEIMTGDMPTPIKYKNDEIRKAYKAIETEANASILELLPSELRASYKQYFMPQDPMVKQIIKAADKICALIKCIEEIHAGNPDFSTAKRSTEKAIAQIDLPCVSYFMKNMLPAYTKTLDELQQREGE